MKDILCFACVLYSKQEKNPNINPLLKKVWKLIMFMNNPTYNQHF